jgi:hypothetical protein
LGLVTFTADHAFLHLLGFRCLRLEGVNPAGAFSNGTSLQGVFVTTKLEEELIEAILRDIRDLSLDGC